MESEKTNDKNLLIGIAVAIAVGYFTHWAVGVAIAGLVIYGIVKTPDLQQPPDLNEPQPEKKPFLAKFGDTFKMPTCYETKKDALAAPCDIQSDGNFGFEVAGESNYKTAIWSSIPSEHCKAEKFRLYFVVTLTQEDDNEHDKNAVSIQIKKSTVGYIPRADAKKFRKFADKQGLGKTSTCRAVVVGNKGKDYSIWLDMPIENT